MKKSIKESICLYCGTKFIVGKNTYGKYCNNKCQADHRYETAIAEWKAGSFSGVVGKTKQISRHIKRYLLDINNNTCSICGWDELHPVDNLPLVEIDHIDGDANNNSEENLRVICPNCHAKTSTFRARNRTSSRCRS